MSRLAKDLLSSSLVFQNLIPERGRKHEIRSRLIEIGEIVFQNLIPERGRKRSKHSRRV